MKVPEAETRRVAGAYPSEIYSGSAKAAELVADARHRRRARAIWIASSVAIVVLIMALIMVVKAAGGNDESPANPSRAATEDPDPSSSVVGDLTEDGGLAVSRKDFGEAWPLTIKEGILRCDDDAVTIELSGKIYALNAKAQARGLGSALAPVWAPSSDLKGARMSTAALIADGLTLCG